MGNGRMAVVGGLLGAVLGGCSVHHGEETEPAGTGGQGEMGGGGGGGEHVGEGGGVPACTAGWATQIGPIDYFANRHALVASDDCSTFVAGRFGGNLSLDGTVLEGAPGATNVFLVHEDSDGSLLWAKALGGDGSYGNPVIAATPSGGVVLSGIVSGPVDFGDGVVSASAPSPFVAAYDATGALIFAHVVDADTTYLEARSVAVGPNGDIWVAGALLGSLTVGATTLTTPPEASAGFVARFDADGTPEWAELLENSYILPVVVDSQGRATVGSPEYIVQFDEEGNLRWEREFLGDGGYINDIAVGPDDGLVVAGAFFGDVDLGFGPVGDGGPPADAEAFILGLDEEGEARWAHTWVDPDAWQVAVSVAVRPNGNVVVFGEDRQYWHSVFLEELGGSGELVAHQTFTALCTGESICDTMASSMRLDRDGNILLSAELQGSVTVAETLIDSSNADSVVIAKLPGVTPDPS